MKLDDWPIDTNKLDDGIACDFGGCSARSTFSPFRADTFAELRRAIVGHAMTVHGIDLTAEPR